MGWAVVLGLAWWVCAGCAPGGALDAVPAAPPPSDASSSVRPPTAAGSSLPATTSECGNPVVRSFPGDSATDVYAYGEIWFELERRPDVATLSVQDAAGRVLPGSTLVEGPMVSWSGEVLAPQASYLAILTTECETAVAEFTTSAVGDPVTFPLPGSVYAVDLFAGEWAAPASLAGLVEGWEGEGSLLLAPHLVSGFALLVARGGAAQDLCVETQWMSGRTWDDPRFVVQADLLPPTSSGLAVREVDLSGSFAMDGTRVQFGRWSGVVDLRERPDVDLCPTDSACVPCPDGELACVEVAIDGLEGEAVSSVVAVRTAQDIVQDVVCQ